MQHFTRFQLTSCSRGPSVTAGLLAERAFAWFITKCIELNVLWLKFAKLVCINLVYRQIKNCQLQQKNLGFGDGLTGKNSVCSFFFGYHNKLTTVIIVFFWLNTFYLNILCHFMYMCSVESVAVILRGMICCHYLSVLFVSFAETRDKCIWRLAWQPCSNIYMLCKLIRSICYV